MAIIPLCSLARGGIRQGDPLSPYLFAIVMNILSILLKEKVDLKYITPFNVRGCVKISHLMYANDLVLSFRANPKSCLNLKYCLLGFFKISGLNIN